MFEGNNNCGGFSQNILGTGFEKLALLLLLLLQRQLLSKHGIKTAQFVPCCVSPGLSLRTLQTTAAVCLYLWPAKRLHVLLRNKQLVFPDKVTRPHFWQGIQTAVALFENPVLARPLIEERVWIRPRQFCHFTHPVISFIYFFGSCTV